EIDRGPRDEVLSAARDAPRLAGDRTTAACDPPTKVCGHEGQAPLAVEPGEREELPAIGDVGVGRHWVRGGGHGVAGYAVPEGGLLIDLFFDERHSGRFRAAARVGAPPNEPVWHPLNRCVSSVRSPARDQRHFLPGPG